MSNMAIILNSPERIRLPAATATCTLRAITPAAVETLRRYYATKVATLATPLPSEMPPAAATRHSRWLDYHADTTIRATLKSASDIALLQKAYVAPPAEGHGYRYMSAHMVYRPSPLRRTQHESRDTHCCRR